MYLTYLKKKKKCTDLIAFVSLMFIVIVLNDCYCLNDWDN